MLPASSVKVKLMIKISLFMMMMLLPFSLFPQKYKTITKLTIR
jgi:hypothetical protein